MNFSNVRVPPDSTGKRLHTTKTIEIDYVLGTSAFSIGNKVVGATSGASGDISKLSGTVVSGTLCIIMDDGSASFSSGELLTVDGNNYATTSGIGTEGHIQNVNLVGGNNHKHRLFVDNKGAASVRFSEGTPQFDAFGSTRSTVHLPIADYFFVYDAKEGTRCKDFQTISAGAATYMHNPYHGAVVLICGTGATDSVQRTTNKYHINLPGNGHLIYMGAQIGDEGKANVVRNWGSFNDIDGAFFRINELELEVVVRSITTGSVTEISVAQSDWNTDKLDGLGGLTNPSGLLLDISKWNIYWIDFQYANAATIRFGIFGENGERIICHVCRGNNLFNYPLISSSSLPVRYEQFNLALSQSTSTMSVGVISIKSEGEIGNEETRNHGLRNGIVTNKSVTTDDTPIVSLRAVQTINGIGNRKPIVPEFISIYTDQPILLKWVIGGSLTGSSFSLLSGSIVEIDTSATVLSDGSLWYTEFLAPGSHKIDIGKHFHYLNEYICILADGSYGDIHSVVVDKNGSNAQVDVSLVWMEFG